MKIPYNVLHVSGNILFAARGGKLHSFSLEDGHNLSTWQHPDVEKVASAVKEIAAEKTQDEKAVREDVAMMVQGDNDEPPAKRQKLHEPPSEATSGAAITSEGKQADEKPKGKGGKKSKNRRNDEPRKEDSKLSRVPDRPVITHLTSTTDGGHLLAISGHDKIIWVFQHDGKGLLTQLSKRIMPKRPSSVAIAPDSNIICADKFGDVYSLPLIFTPSEPSATPSSTATPASQNVRKPEANATTVHSKRNLRSLEHQARQLELASRAKQNAPKKPEGSEFEHTLLLGHVSMLTSLVLGETNGRRYILTADRDEHIRISRYIPQAYVIEAYCFGHREFVSNMAIPASKSEVLVSGGGDEELFVWDWKAGKLLSKTNILSVAQTILPELAKVAVSGISSLQCSRESGAHTFILAICEDIPAIFSWQLTSDNTLQQPAVIQLPGKPLDIAVTQKEGEAPKLIAAIDLTDPTEGKSLSIYTLTTNEEKLAVGSADTVNDGALEAEELDVPEKEARALLYTTENLRKQKTEHDEEEEEAPAGSVPTGDAA